MIAKEVLEVFGAALVAVAVGFAVYHGIRGDAMNAAWSAGSAVYLMRRVRT
jgi:hypothetical protein